jgi:hypothetical protein
MNADQFTDFSLMLVERSGRTDWPDGSSEYWIDFHQSLRSLQASFAEADEASRRACNQRGHNGVGMFVSDFRPFILAEIPKVRAERQAASRATSGSREDAEAASRNCADCSGRGLAVRSIHPEIAGLLRSRSGEFVPVGASAGFFCGCPLGQWLAARNVPPEATRPPATVADYPALRLGPVHWTDELDNQYRYRPAHWDAGSGMPFDAGLVMDLGDLRALFADASKASGTRKVLAMPERDLSHLTTIRRSDLSGAIEDPIIERERPRPVAVTRDDDDWF